jgi:hypothetical protein
MGFFSFFKYTFIIFAAHLVTSCGAPFENHCSKVISFTDQHGRIILKQEFFLLAYYCYFCWAFYQVSGHFAVSHRSDVSNSLLDFYKGWFTLNLTQARIAIDADAPLPPPPPPTHFLLIIWLFAVCCVLLYAGFIHNFSCWHPHKTIFTFVTFIGNIRDERKIHYQYLDLLRCVNYVMHIYITNNNS